MAAPLVALAERPQQGVSDSRIQTRWQVAGEHEEEGRNMSNSLAVSAVTCS